MMSNNIMTHVVIGYPDLRTTEKILEVMVSCGVTKIELQVPFSDTLADGPIIMKANDTALEGSITTSTCFDFLNNQHKKFQYVDFYLMTYYQKVFSFGNDKFIESSAASGAKGLIVPDFPFDCQEAKEFSRLLNSQGIEFIPVLSSGIPDTRLEALLAYYSDYSFVYLTARHGVTGSKTRKIESLLPDIQRIKKLSSSKQVGIGFGISTLADVSAANKIADFAVVGSQIIRVLQEDGLKGLESYLRTLLI